MKPGLGQRVGRRCDKIQRASIVAATTVEANAMVTLSVGLGLGRPGNLHLAMLSNTVAKVKVDQTLVRNTNFSSHDLEILHYVFG
jgi:hypothetical protein